MAVTLVTRHFIRQRVRPHDLADVPLAHLDAELRTLLFTDGTVTRALEANSLRRVTVVVAEESAVRVPAELAECVDLPTGAEACQRRVTLCSDPDDAPLACAESLIVYERLPSWFLALLSHSRQGLGEALAAGGLESRRELLWFGLGAVPAWCPDVARTPALVRAYRVVISERPAMVITEAFPVRSEAGVYALRA